MKRQQGSVAVVVVGGARRAIAWSSRRIASLRVRLFIALAAATMCGALATGLYAVVADRTSLGFEARLVKVTPKALALAAFLLPAAALAAAIVGRRLARPIEDLTDAASRIAEGQRSTRLPRGEGEEMRRLARALVSMRRELEGKPYAGAFLRDAWHDLKTPVAALKATLEVLEDVPPDDVETTRRFLDNMRRSTFELERTLSDLITLARFETASISSDEVAKMSDIVSDALARVAPLAEATNVSTRIDDAPRSLSHAHAHAHAHAHTNLCCDPTALTRALGNLLENAVNATASGGHVGVRIDVSMRNTITVEVVNEPAIVHPEARRHLFERRPGRTMGIGTTSTGTTDRNGTGSGTGTAVGNGSGLGLAMARAAIEAHGGTIRFVELGPPRVRVRLELPR